jgi:hypothetical protein
MKFLTRAERDFLVCSDCAHFVFKELIDDRYPMIKRGICTLHDKLVDNRWATDCEDNTANFTCKDCIHCTDNEEYVNDTDSYYYDMCDITNEEIDLNDCACERFEK